MVPNQRDVMRYPNRKDSTCRMKIDQDETEGSPKYISPTRTLQAI